MDLFQQIIVRVTNPSADLTMGPPVTSDADQLIQLLEQQATGTTAVRSLPADPLVAVAVPSTESAELWFLTDHDERWQIELEISDVTAVSTPVKSTELWFLHRNDDGRGVRVWP